MVTYAPVPAFAERKRYPRALILIVAGHAALIAAVMMAKMDLPQPFRPPVIKVELIPEPKAPPEFPPEPRPAPEPGRSIIDKPVALVPIPSDSGPLVDTSPIPLPDPGPVIGPSPRPSRDVVARPIPVRTGPRFATPDSRLRPPYPPHKLRNGEEAALRLRLSIDERGRVTAVEPVGRADPAFLGAARRHLIAHWRYQPATEDGRPVATSTVITLRFELDD